MLTGTLSQPLNRGLATEIAVRLQMAILHGELEPGTRLREEVLAEKMGVSRGPIREAFGTLEREGLVTIRRNRGTYVARLRHKDLDEVYSLRLALELLAVQRAIAMGTDADFDQIQSIVDTMAGYVQRGITEQESAELDIRFHDSIYLASRHQRLYECWTNLKPQIYIMFLSRNMANPDFRGMVVEGHQEILDAIRDRADERALALTEKHLRSTYEYVARRYSD